MATPLTPTAYQSALYVLFPQKRIASYGVGEQNFYTWIPKKQGFGGRNAEIPIEIGPGGGTSPDFQTAQEAKSGGDIRNFTVTRTRAFNVIAIDNETIEASEGSENSYMNAYELQVENGFKKQVQRLGWDMQGDGTGLQGVVQSAGLTATTFRVTQDQFPKFNVKDRVVFCAAGTPTTPRAGVLGFAVISKKDPNSLTLTVSTTLGGDNLTTLGVVATDLVYWKGGIGNALTGTKAWIPTVANRPVSATLFKGVDRSESEGDLAGYAFDGSTYGLAESLERALSFGSIANCNPEVVWLNYGRFTDLSRELGASCVRETVKVANFAFDSIKINARGRETRVMADINFADDDALACTRSSWKFWTLKGAPRFLTDDRMLNEVASNGVEIRQGWYGDLICTKPNDNLRIKLPV